MDATSDSLREQSNVLKEIRDEIRASRTTNPLGGQASVTGRPHNTFVQSQMMMDRMASGEWANMGWANAYTSRFQSSWMADISAAAGAQRSTNTMTQMEFQNNAFQSLGNRATRLIGGIVSPHYTGEVQHLTQDIFENSQRFARFGDSLTGIMGSGMNLGASNKLARQVTALSFNDMRMNSADYSDTVSIGMKNSQYDHVQSNEEFLKKTKDLASAVGDLTRTLHLSVKEIGDSMGAMRQRGIVDVADQRRELMKIQAAAQIGGLTTGQAMNAWDGAAQSGFTMGISAQVSGQVGVGNTALTRQMSREGVISQTTMALGGGAEGIGRSITDAQLRHLSSQAGYLQALGGGGRMGQRSSMSDMMDGLSEVGGSIDKILSSEARKTEFIEKMSKDPGAVTRNYNRSIEDQINWMTGSGNKPGQKPYDMGSEGARDRAYSLVRGDMGDAAGLAYANTNFSYAGRRNRDYTAFTTDMAGDIQQNKLDYDRWAINNTKVGKLQSGLKVIRSLPGRMADWGMRQWEGNGQTSVFDASSPMAQNMEAHEYGAVVDTVSPDDFLKSIHGETSKPKNIIDFDVSHHPKTWLPSVNQTVGALASAYAASTLMSKYTNWDPLTKMATTVGAGLLGVAGGNAITKYTNDNSDSGTPQIQGEMARDYTERLKAIDGASKLPTDTRHKSFEKLMAESIEFRKEASGYKDRSHMNEQDSINYANSMRNMADKYGMTEPEVAAAHEEAGIKLGLAHGYRGFDEKDKKSSLKDLSTDLFSGLTTSGGIDFANSSNAKILKNLLTPYDAANGKDAGNVSHAQARKQLIDMGMSHGDLDRLERNAGLNHGVLQARKDVTFGPYGGFSEQSYNAQIDKFKNINSDVLAALDTQIDKGAQAQKNKIFKAGTSVASNILGADASLPAFSQYAQTNDVLGMISGLKGTNLEKQLSAGNTQFEHAFMVSRMSMKELDAVMPNDKLGLGEGDLKSLKADIGSFQGTDKQRLERAQRGFEAFILSGTGINNDHKEIQSEKEANIFGRAAMILDKLAASLGVK